MYVELLGYGSQGICHLKLLTLPYVEVHVQRASTGAFLQQGINFAKNAKEENLMLNVAKEFYASKGDAAAYVEILMKYYRSCVPAKKRQKEIEGDANHGFRMAIACELEAIAVRDFANEIDSEYEEALMALVGWSEATTELLSDNRVRHYYDLFQESFPLTHMVFSTIVSSKSKKLDLNATMFPSTKVVASTPASCIPLGDLTTTCAVGVSLPKKERIALNSWLSLIRARSRDLLKTWSRTQRKEQCTVSIADQSLHDRLCGNDSARKDYDQFESDCDDDSLQSMASTCCESQANNVNQTEEEDQPADADNWENLKEDDRSDKIEDALKHLGNVRKKKMSPNILKDLLGDDGNHAIKGIKTNHENLMHREKRKLSEIYKAVSYFETKMSKRRSTLREKRLHQITIPTFDASAIGVMPGKKLIVEVEVPV